MAVRNETAECSGRFGHCDEFSPAFDIETVENLPAASGRSVKEGETETMNKSTYPLNLPLSIKKAAQRLAKEDGVSLNQWIAVAVVEKVGVVETAAEFFKKRAGKSSGQGLMKFLRTAPKTAPEPEDTL
jgi:hypothetical protein